MKINTLLKIFAVTAGIFFVGLVLLPAFWISLYGANADSQAIFLIRLVGALFGGLAVMAWAGRDAEPSKSREAMVLGLTILNGFAAVTALYGAITGVYNHFAWGPVIIFSLFTIGFFNPVSRRLEKF